MIKNIWPIKSPVVISDKIALKIGRLPGYCNICGNFTLFDVSHPNFREHVVCTKCQSRNRQRQLIYLLLFDILNDESLKFASIRDIPTDIVLWNAESTGALHKKLSEHLKDNYICSEYIDSSLRSGDMKDGMLHVDIQETHFDDNSLDYILSGDVMEHVPFPLKALKETYRILKPGGCHIFTAPFYHHRFTNEIRTIIDENGEHRFLRKAWYHDDPVHETGALVYTIFAPELLVQLEQVGFEPRLCLVHSVANGILGNNGIVIIAKKSISPDQKVDWIFPPESD